MSTPASAEIGWYATEDVRCEGAASLGAAFRAGGWLTPSIDVVGTAPATGKVHIRLSIADLQAVTAAKGALTLGSHALTAISSPKVRALLVGVDQPVPALESALLDLVTGYVIHAETKAIVDGLMMWLINERKQPTISPAALGFFVAQGGVLQDVLSVYEGKDKRRHAIHTTSYSVQVAREIRTVVLYTCRYAVETKVAEFRTVGPYNNKRVWRDGTQWRVIDVDTSKNDKEILTYEGQDEEFFYFAVEGDPEQRRRMSFKRGPWQLFDSGKWKTLYAQIDAY